MKKKIHLLFMSECEVLEQIFFGYAKDNCIQGYSVYTASRKLFNVSCNKSAVIWLLLGFLSQFSITAFSLMASHVIFLLVIRLCGPWTFDQMMCSRVNLIQHSQHYLNSETFKLIKTNTMENRNNKNNSCKSITILNFIFLDRFTHQWWHSNLPCCIFAG